MPKTRRRGFLSIGLGAAAVGSVAPAPAQAAAWTRDIKWARVQTQAGRRVRLESWRVPVAERPQIEAGASTMTVRQGSPEGVVSVEELVLTVETLEGPWEIVPEADYPKPPPPLPPTEAFTINTFSADGSGGDITLTGGHGVGGAVGGIVTVSGGSARRLQQTPRVLDPIPSSVGWEALDPAIPETLLGYAPLLVGLSREAEDDGI